MPPRADPSRTPLERALQRYSLKAFSPDGEKEAKYRISPRRQNRNG
jgi:hypothetical protein